MLCWNMQQHRENSEILCLVIESKHKNVSCIIAFIWNSRVNKPTCGDKSHTVVDFLGQGQELMRRTLREPSGVIECSVNWYTFMKMNYILKIWVFLSVAGETPKS